MGVIFEFESFLEWTFVLRGIHILCWGRDANGVKLAKEVWHGMLLIYV
jgi:hypothetical protein